MVRLVVVGILLALSLTAGVASEEAKGKVLREVENQIGVYLVESSEELGKNYVVSIGGGDREGEIREAIVAEVLDDNVYRVISKGVFEVRVGDPVTFVRRPGVIGKVYQDPVEPVQELKVAHYEWEPVAAELGYTHIRWRVDLINNFKGYEDVYVGIQWISKDGEQLGVVGGKLFIPPGQRRSILSTNPVRREALINGRAKLVVIRK